MEPVFNSVQEVQDFCSTEKNITEYISVERFRHEIVHITIRDKEKFIEGFSQSIISFGNSKVQYLYVDKYEDSIQL